jgi:hypothetical protein
MSIHSGWAPHHGRPRAARQAQCTVRQKIQERLDIRQKLVLAAYGTPLMTKVGLPDFGIEESLDDGPVLPREERIQQVLAQA